MSWGYPKPLPRSTLYIGYFLYSQTHLAFYFMYFFLEKNKPSHRPPILIINCNLFITALSAAIYSWLSIKIFKILTRFWFLVWLICMWWIMCMYRMCHAVYTLCESSFVYAKLSVVYVLCPNLEWLQMVPGMSFAVIETLWVVCACGNCCAKGVQHTSPKSGCELETLFENLLY